MNVRVTLQTMVNRAQANMRKQTDRLGRLQHEASTGLRLLNPSDDLLAMASVIETKAQDGQLAMYLDNIQQARTALNISVSSLTEGGNVLAQARRTAIEAANSVNDTASLEVFAQQIDALLGRMLTVANTQHAGQYIYSGTAVTTPAFSVTAGTPAAPQRIDYQGAAEAGTVPVSQQQTVNTPYVGSEVFQQTQRGPTVFTGNTGATPGSGTDSGTGEGTLQVRHTGTTYGGASGVAPGTLSAAGDTILGPSGANQLILVAAGGSGTVSLNGGPAVAFTPGPPNNLQVTGPNGEVVFLDTSGIINYGGPPIDITANGTLSTDSGQTQVPIVFTGSGSTNQIVTNSLTGEVTHVNSTNIRRAGDAQVSYTGTHDAFQVLMALRDDLRNTRGINESQQLQTISARVADLDRVRTGLLDVVGEQSADLENLDGLERRQQDIQLETRRLTSTLESADITEVVLNLQAEQNLLQLTMGSIARVFDQSLLNFLR